MKMESCTRDAHLQFHFHSRLLAWKPLLGYMVNDKGANNFHPAVVLLVRSMTVKVFYELYARFAIPGAGRG